MYRQPLTHRSPNQDLGLPGYCSNDEESNQLDSTDTNRNISVVSHSESSDSRLIPAASSSSVASISLMSSTSLSVPSKKMKSSLPSSSSFLSTFLSEGDDDFSTFLRSLSDTTGLTMDVDPLKCDDVEEDCYRSLLPQRADFYLDSKDQEQDRGRVRVEEVLVGSRSHPSLTHVSTRERNQEQEHEAAKQNMTLADRILRMHRDSYLDTKESLLKSCTGPYPAATSKHRCSQQ